LSLRPELLRFVARIRDLNALQRRDLLASAKVSADELIAYGRHYLEAEMYHEALRFFAKAGDADGLAACKEAAVATGDHDLMWQLAHSPLAQVTEEDWRCCAQKAVEMGKRTAAAYIYRRLGDTAALEALERDAERETPARTEDGSA